MDGKTALYQLRQLLEEDASSGFLDTYTSYQFLNEAASDFATRTKCLRATDSITTVASTAEYDLAADFAGLYLMNSSKKFYLKYNDGTNNHFVTWKPYEEVIYADQSSTTASVPGNFTVTDNPTLASQVTGTVTSTAAATGGKSTLTDTAGDFSNVEAGDYVHNTTDGSHGIVISKTSSTVLDVALFNGTADDWTSGDAYVIQPQGRMQLVFDPPPSTSGHTVTVYHLQRPNPVYHDYGVFRFPSQYVNALVKYAAWLYKYREREPNYGDKWYVYYDNQAKIYGGQFRRMTQRNYITVNMKARR